MCHKKSKLEETEQIRQFQQKIYFYLNELSYEYFLIGIF